MDDTRLPELSRILFEAAGDTMTIEAFGHECDCKCGDAEATLAVLSRLTFTHRNIRLRCVIEDCNSAHYM
jgi:hypothetical protein